MKTVILAAGQWKRLLPLTENTPKPMVNILWKPILEHIFNTLIWLTNDVTIITKYKEDQIKNYFKDNFKWIKISYHTQVDKKWTWAALFWLNLNEDFIVLNWDTIYYRKDLEKLYKLNQYGCLVKTVTKTERYWIFEKDENDNALKIVEKPDKYIWNLANIWVYKFPKKIIKLIENIKPSKRLEYEITDAINNLLKDTNFKLVKLDWDFIDVWYPQDIQRVENILKTLK